MISGDGVSEAEKLRAEIDARLEAYGRATIELLKLMLVRERKRNEALTRALIRRSRPFWIRWILALRDRLPSAREAARQELVRYEIETAEEAAAVHACEKALTTKS